MRNIILNTFNVIVYRDLCQKKIQKTPICTYN